MLKLNEHEELDGAQLIWLLEEMKEFLVFTTQHNIFSFSRKKYFISVILPNLRCCSLSISIELKRKLPPMRVIN